VVVAGCCVELECEKDVEEEVDDDAFGVLGGEDGWDR
jgi:hypothetical protein